MKQKGNVVLIVLLIALAIGGYFYFGKINLNKPTPQQTSQPSPTSDETATWKTYTNPLANFSFQYPSNWFTSERVSNNTVKDVEITSCDIKNNPFCTREKNQIIISVRLINTADIYEGAKDMEEYYQRQTKSPNSGKNKRSITINNIPAIRFSTKGGEGDMEGIQFNGDTVVLEDKGNLYTLKVSINVGSSGKSDNLTEAIKIFDEILSTFKFIE